MSQLDRAKEIISVILKKYGLDGYLFVEPTIEGRAFVLRIPIGHEVVVPAYTTDAIREAILPFIEKIENSEFVKELKDGHEDLIRVKDNVIASSLRKVHELEPYKHYVDIQCKINSGGKE